jgi:hypothetical protein
MTAKSKKYPFPSFFSKSFTVLFRKSLQYNKIITLLFPGCSQVFGFQKAIDLSLKIFVFGAFFCHFRCKHAIPKMSVTIS